MAHEWRSTCCNPFNKKDHTAKRTNLRPVSEWMCEKDSKLSIGSKICDVCRKKLATTIPEPQHEPSTDKSPTPSPPWSPLPEEECKSVKFINECLEDIGETPITKRKLRTKKYSEQKLEHLTTMMGTAIVGKDTFSRLKDGSEKIEQLKEKFHSTSENSVKVQVLTVLPRSWSIRMIQTEFGASNFMARRAKQLVMEKGVMSTPDPKPRHCIAKKSIDLVVGFYESDNSSRMMPGRKDFVSVKQVHGRVQIQKRLILCNLKELYRQFKDEYPSENIGFSKFADLRPKHCVLAGARGTHSVCVCTIHQNVKLMLLGAKLHELTANDDTPLENYHHCLAKLICNPPLPKCYLGACSVCPGIEELKDHLIKVLDENMVDIITYKQWTAVDRSTLETVSEPSDEFVESFGEKLGILLSHSFIATQQSMFYNQCKSSLKLGEIVVSADFSENYAFILQDAAQGFQWNNSQATIHPFVAYFRESDSINHLSFVIISDILHHDTIAGYLYQKRLIAFLKKNLVAPQKIIYFSDGAASQYKNRKNFINLCHHQADFGLRAEWHFSATSHGKGACDGLGGTVKRLAAKTSLQRPYENQIMTPFQLFQWASESIPKVTFCYCCTREYESEKSHLERRFQKSKTIPGTRGLHSFVPTSKNTLLTRRYSLSDFSKEERVTIFPSYRLRSHQGGR